MFDYIRLLPGFLREALDAYEKWNGNDSVPMKLKELMRVLQIEASHQYK